MSLEQGLRHDSEFRSQLPSKGVTVDLFDQSQIPAVDINPNLAAYSLPCEDFYMDSSLALTSHEDQSGLRDRQ